MAESSGAAHEAGAGSAESGDDSADPDGTSDGGSDLRGAASAASRVKSPWSTLDLQIQNPCGYPEVSARRLRPWLEEVLAELAPDAASATVRFVSDREMRGLNRDYRGFDQSTDVLSFPGDLPPRRDAATSKQAPAPGPEPAAVTPPTVTPPTVTPPTVTPPTVTPPTVTPPTVTPPTVTPPELPTDEPHLGDIVVSVPTARRQAEERGQDERGHSIERELRLLALHGILHCLGYDHESDDGTMERVEDELRRRHLAEAT